MTIHFYHNGNSLGEVRTDTALEAEIFAATSHNLPFTSAAQRATGYGWEVLTFNEEDAALTVTHWQLLAAA